MLVFTEAGIGVPVQGKKNPKQRITFGGESFQPNQFYELV